MTSSLLLGFSSGLGATNYASRTGNSTSICSVRWRAETVLDTDLSNDDPTYPGLMTNASGAPVDYSNGGYITEVRPEYGDPGMFEINHWYTNTTSPTAGTAVYWRIPISTDSAIDDAVVTVTLPGPASGFAFDGVSTNSRMPLWGAPYSNYSWSDVSASAASSTDGMTWTIDLGDMAAGSGHVFQFNGTVPPGTYLTDPVLAVTNLTGTYGPGVETCAESTTTTTQAPTPTSAAANGSTTTVAPSTSTVPTTSVTPTTNPHSVAGLDTRRTPAAQPATAVRGGRLAYAG